MKPSILITGVSSNLMKPFMSIIEFEKYDVFAITRNKKLITNKNIHVHEGDICDRGFIHETVKDIHTVIHAAAVTHAFHERDYNRVNVKGTQNLVNAAKLNGVKRFVFVSSRAAGLNNGAYGQSKYQGEKYVKKHLDNWLIFRPAEIYGGSKNEGIDKLIQDVLTKKILLCPANVRNKLYPVFIDDVVNIMYDKLFNEQPKNETITINGQKGFTYIELVKYICQTLSLKRIITPVPKIIMQILAVAIKRMNIRSGFVPDQISRLYCDKETQTIDYEFRDFEKHLFDLTNKDQA